MSGNHLQSRRGDPPLRPFVMFLQGSFIKASHVKCKYFIREEGKLWLLGHVYSLTFFSLLSTFLQNEEIEAMAAIYGEEWCVIDDCAKIFCIRISDDIDDPKWTLCLQVFSL